MWRIGCLLLAVGLCALGPVARASEEPEEETPSGEVELAPEALEVDPERIVVTATRILTPEREVASSITVIDRQEIERKQRRFVVDLLREAPGVDVVQSGGPGQPSQVFLRGAKPEHTLVLIDGIEANDPFSPGRTFNFAGLTTDNIERIEIIRGPQSTLYGSDAMGGVVNIITRRGVGPPSGFVTGEAGSRDTYRTAVGLRGAQGAFDYSLSLSHYTTRGISAADASLPGNTKRDGYENTTLSSLLGWTPNDAFSLDLILRYSDGEGELDQFGGPFGDDPNYFFRDKAFFGRLQGTLVTPDGRWEQKLGVSFTDYDRRFRDDPDPMRPMTMLRSKYKGRILKLAWQSDFYLSDVHTITFGLETEEESGRSRIHSESELGPFTSVIPEQKARTNSAYLQDSINIGDTFFATVGARIDDHEEFGSETTYRIAPAYLIEETGTKLKGSWGTGFKAPTLFQLFSEFGDPDLDPERSKGWDVGVEQHLAGDRLMVGATYFHNTFDDLIDFNPATSTYFNIDRARTRGVELTGAVRATDDLSFRATYTRQDTEDRNTGESLLRRPEDQVSFDVNYTLRRKTNLNLNVVYVGRREDMDFNVFPAERVDLSSYMLVNLAAVHDVSDRFQLFGRIENVLDKDYQEVFGFGTPGRGFFGGVTVRF